MRAELLGVTAVMITIGGCTQPLDAAPLRSGFYEGFVLAVSPAGQVTGHFDMEQGEVPTKRCRFDFVGQVRKGSAEIRTLDSPNLRGTITGSTAEDVTFSMPGVNDLPGCGLVLPPEAETGIELGRIRPGDWTDLAVVKSARVAFKPAPGGSPGRAYVVKGDVLGILARQGSQVQVVYPSERDHWAQGWVSASDLTPLAP
jgi:hypothetical protein